MVKGKQTFHLQDIISFPHIFTSFTIHYSFASLSKYGNTSTGYNHFQTPRIRSAYPMKKQAQPIRIRSAYPLKSPPLPNSGMRIGARSGYANDRYRSRSPLKNADFVKIVDETARLSIQNEMSVTGGEIVPYSNKTSPTKSYTQLKRLRLQPSSLPKFTENVLETAILPPLSESKTSFRSKVKPKTNPATLATSQKSANNNYKTLNGDTTYSIVGRKPTSAAQHRNIPPLSKPGQYQQYRQMYNIPGSQTTNRTGNRNDVEVNIELVGTSLSLFEPIVRPVRPIAIPKLRTNFWSNLLPVYN